MFNIFRRYFILRMSIVKRNREMKKKWSIEKNVKNFRIIHRQNLLTTTNWIVSKTSSLIIVWFNRMIDEILISMQIQKT